MTKSKKRNGHEGGCVGMGKFLSGMVDMNNKLIIKQRDFV